MLLIQRHIIRERSSVLYLGMAKEIFTLTMAKEATTLYKPQNQAFRENDTA